jgi:peptidoglycan/LPS O-acetylase OafA/YrhL
MFHALRMAPTYGLDTGWLGRSGEWGSCGVDVFFVLSGVVLTLSVDKTMPQARAFFLARCRRVVPLYATLTVLLMLLPLVLPALFRGQPPAWTHALASLVFSSQWLIGQVPVLYVGWSLEYEMLFYAAMALCLLTRNMRLVLWGCSGLLLMGVVAGLPPVVIEFVLGVLVARTLHVGARWGMVLSLVGVGSLCASAGILFDVESWRALIWGLPAALMLAGLIRMPQIAPGLGSFLGEASYSIYLIQVFALPAVYKVVQRWLAAMPADAVTMLAVVSTVCAGVLVHLFVEKPLARMTTHGARTPKGAPAKAHAS